VTTRKSNNKINKTIKNNKKIRSNLITFDDIMKHFDRKNGNFTEKDIRLINTFNNWIEYNDKLARDGSLNSLDSLQNLNNEDY
jgi:hypothetical protein